MTTAISTLTTRPLLRPVLKLDAVVTGANGAAYLVAAGPLGELLGLSETLLRVTGAFLLAYAALVWIVGARREIPRGPLYAIVAVAGWWSPTTAGTAWILLQAATVAGFAVLQAAALRRR